jgi:hypothetical protein
VHATMLGPGHEDAATKKLPTLDDIDITVWPMGDQSCGVHIPGSAAASSRRSGDVASGPDKGKEKAASFGFASKVSSWPASCDTETLSEEVAPLERERRLAHSDGSSVNGLPLPEQ